MVNLDLYRVFYAVAKQGSLTKAAAELYISQPAVSQSIKQLENQLGVPLFNRTHRGMELSEEGGKRIIDKVERALRLLSEAEKEASNAAGKGGGEVRLCVSEDVFRYVVAEKTATFSKKYPDVKVRLVKMREDKLQEGLISGKIDVAVSARPCSCDGCVISYPAGILPETAYLAGEEQAKRLSSVRGAKSAKGKGTPPLSVKDLPRIALEGEDETGAVVTGADVETAKRLAAAGAGVVLMPKIFAEKEIAENKLFVLPIEPPAAETKPLFVSINEKSEKEKIVSAFLSVVNLAKP